MRVALTIFKYFPYGGIQRDMMKIARALTARGHEAKIFTLRWEAPELDDSDALSYQVLPIIGLPRHVQYEHFAEHVRDAVAEQEFDLVVGFNKMAGLDVYYAGDSCYVEKAHNQRSAAYRLLPRFKSFVAQERAVFAAESTTQILTISNVEVPRYRHHYRTQAERFHPLPPGIERDRVAPANQAELRQKFRAELGLDPDDLMVLFIGSGFKKKGLDRALLAIADLPVATRKRVRFFVIGRDKPEAFERMADRLGLEVTFFAEGRDDVPNFLFSADALIHPAYDENAGMVIVEAILAGLPVLATRNCGYAQYIDQFQAGLIVDAGVTQTDLNHAVLELLTSDQRAEWRGASARASTDESLFQLVPRAVELIEQFGHGQRKVLLFCLFRYFAYGGLQRDFMRIAEAAQSKGYQIVVFCLQWFGDKPEGFTVIEVEASGVANHSRYEQFAEYVAEHAAWWRPVAVIGFNKIPGLDIYYAADPCFELKAQTMRSPLYRRTARYQLMSKYERAVFSPEAKTEVLLITQLQAEQFAQTYQTPNERLHILPPGVSPDRKRANDWQESRAKVRAELQVGEDEFLLLLVGSGFVTKGVDRALLAVAALPGDLRSRCRFLIIGQDKPDAFIRQTEKLGIANQVTIQPGRGDIPDVLQAADLMIHPAYMESGGLVLIEAIIAGLPVIATSVCGFAHYIEDADAGVVLDEPFSQAQLNSTVESVLNDSEQRTQWSERGVAFGQARDDLYDMPAKALALIEATL